MPVKRSGTGRVVGLGLMALALALTFVLTVPAGVLASISTGDGGWIWQNPLPQANPLNDVDFVDSTHGWAVGAGGTILATSNRGATWQAQSLGYVVNLKSAAFSDLTHGWAVGEGYSIVATTDGGATWHVQIMGGGYSYLNGAPSPTPRTDGPSATGA